MQITKMTITLELFFREAILDDPDAFVRAMMSNGFSLMSAEQSVVARGNMTARPSRFTRIKGKGMNIAAIAIREDQISSYIAHINLIRMIMRDEMGKSMDDELEACSLLTNSWVRGRARASQVLGSIDVSKMISLNEFSNFIAHRNPFGKIEFVSLPGDGQEWSKMELDYTDDDEYLLSIHNYTNTLERVFEHLRGLSSYITSCIRAVEDMVAGKERGK